VVILCWNGAKHLVRRARRHMFARAWHSASEEGANEGLLASRAKAASKSINIAGEPTR
jgi:hypothetical protein